MSDKNDQNSLRSKTNSAGKSESGNSKPMENASKDQSKQNKINGAVAVGDMSDHGSPKTPDGGSNGQHTPSNGSGAINPDEKVNDLYQSQVYKSDQIEAVQDNSVLKEENDKIQDLDDQDDKSGNTEINKQNLEDSKSNNDQPNKEHENHNDPDKGLDADEEGKQDSKEDENSIHNSNDEMSQGLIKEDEPDTNSIDQEKDPEEVKQIPSIEEVKQNPDIEDPHSRSQSHNSQEAPQFLKSSKSVSSKVNSKVGSDEAKPVNSPSVDPDAHTKLSVEGNPNTHSCRF